MPLRGSPRLDDDVTVIGAALLDAPRETHGRIISIVDDDDGATLRIDAALPPAGAAGLVVDADGAPVALAIGLSILDGRPVLKARPLRTLKRRAPRGGVKRPPTPGPNAPNVAIPLLAPLPRADLGRLQQLSDASLALALENEGDAQLLEQHLDAALRWNPLSAAPWIRLARHLDGAGRWSEAQQAYEAAAVLPGDQRQAHCALAALTLHKRGVHERAEALARRCLAAEPRHSLSLAVLGAALAGNGNSGGALPLLQQATSQDPSVGWAHGVIGAIHHDAGDLEAAVIAYRQAIRATPRSASLRLALGDAQLARNIPERALRAFRAAEALDRQNAVIASRVGDALAVLGRSSEAQTAYQRALSIDPKLDGVAKRLRALRR